MTHPIHSSRQRHSLICVLVAVVVLSTLVTTTGALPEVRAQASEKQFGQSDSTGTGLGNIQPHDIPDIVGGADADIGAWPWQAALIKAEEEDVFQGQFCGGSLVAPGWVLTAAHCIDNRSLDEVQVVLGQHDLTKNDGERIAVVAILPHPNYFYQSGYYSFDLQNDVALVQLAELSQQTPILPYALTEESDEMSFLSATVTGWGHTSSSSYSDSRSEVLQQVTLPLISHETCNGYDAYYGQVAESMLCAGYAKGTKGSCYGDSGGPLVGYSRESEQWLQLGIVSWGEGCARANKYDVYTRVSSYAGWIQACIEDVNSSGCLGTDDFEPDNSADEATILNPGEAQEHTIHKASDKDWYQFEAEVNATYTISTEILSGEIDTFIWLYESDGLTTLAGDDDSGSEKSSKVVWTATRAGTYTFSIVSLTPKSRSWGRYQVLVQELKSGPDGAQEAGRDNMVLLPIIQMAQ